MVSGLAMCYNPARREDARLPGCGGLGEGGGVVGARSPESREPGARAQGVRMRARGRRGGAARGGGGGGDGIVGVVISVARTVRFDAGGRGKVSGVAQVGPVRPRSPPWRISGSGHRRPVPRRASGRSRGRAPGGRAVPVSPGRRGPPAAGSPRGPVSASVSVALGPRWARVSAEAPAGRGKALVLRSPPGEGCSVAAEL